MASLPPIRKLYIEDYPTQKGWIGPFLITLNTFMTSVVQALTKDLTLVENTTSDIRTITLSTVPTANSPVGISWTKPISPVAVLVGNVRALTSTLLLTQTVGIQWQMAPSGSVLQLTNVVGITPTASDIYVLTLVCIAG